MKEMLHNGCRKGTGFHLSTLLPCYLITFLLLSCGSESGRFRLSGRLRNLNMGEFWVYSPDGAIVGIDTIKVRDSRFAYEKEVRGEGTFMIVFPNYSEQPVFAAPGEKVSIKGDATHLKEIEITGSDENEELTKFRKRINRLTPPEIPAVAAEYIKENPTSIVSRFLLSHYFVLTPQPDYEQAAKLTALMLEQDPDNGQLLRLKKQLESVKNNRIGAQLPAFSVVDNKGNTITQNHLKGKVNIITTWASWNYQSLEIQRRLRKLSKQHEGELAILSICVDGDKADCMRRITRDSVPWPTICDGRMFLSPVMQKFGLSTVPAMLISNNKGRITKQNLLPNDIEPEIEKMLKQ